MNGYWNTAIDDVMKTMDLSRGVGSGLNETTMRNAEPNGIDLGLRPNYPGSGKPSPATSGGGTSFFPVRLGGLDVPMTLGTLAYAISPKSIGGRIGSGVVGLRKYQNAQAAQAARLGIESARLGIERERSKALAEAQKSEAADAERKRRVSKLYSLYMSEETPDEYKPAIKQELLATTTPIEASRLGLVPRQLGVEPVKVRLADGVYGFIDANTGRLLRDETGNPVIAPLPTTAVPSATFIRGVGEGGEPVWYTGITRGPGAGTVYQTGAPATPFSVRQYEMDIARKAAEEEAARREAEGAIVEGIGLYSNPEVAALAARKRAEAAPPPTIEEVARKRRELFPTGRESLVDRWVSGKGGGPGEEKTIIRTGRIKPGRPNAGKKFILYSDGSYEIE